MQITDVRIKKGSDPNSKLKAYCSIVLDGMFAIHDLRVVEGSKGLFVSMPSRKTGEGIYKDLMHPITAEARELIQKAIIGAYCASEGRETNIA
ncbi:MAG: SpoVG family protein [Mycobacterium leprae]